MKWFRSHIKHGSRLALLALAIQFALSFGHFHAVAAQAAPAIQSGIHSVAVSADAARARGLAALHGTAQSVQGQKQGPKPASDHDTTDACAICAVIAMANAVLFSTPPLLELPQAVEFLYLTTDAEFIHLNSVRVAFQPRAPPIS